ncbi:MAG TPA: hypothetical protein VH372_11935 [Actinospica sp.]|nr:hypothetical protein [Actinospica sp.]
MPSIEIRDLPEETYEKLERLAFATGQSVSQYVRSLVLRETGQLLGPPAFAGPADPARQRRTQQAFGGDAAADPRETRERWRDL